MAASPPNGSPANGSPPNADSPTVIVSTAPPKAEGEQPISAEERRSLGTMGERNYLDAIEPERKAPSSQDLAQAALPRTAVVLLLTGCVAFIAIVMTIFLNVGDRQAQAPQPTTAVVPLNQPPSQADALKTQLALVDQQVESDRAKSKPTPASPALSPSSPSRSPVRPSPSRASFPQRSLAPPTPRVLRPVERPATPPVPKADPTEQWTKLAAIGTVGGAVPRSGAQQDNNLNASALSLPRSAGERGIVGQQAGFAAESFDAVGASAQAIVLLPVVWLGDADSTPQSAVQLTEPLMDPQGQVLLPQDSVLLTEVVAADPNSRILEQRVTTALYHQNGQEIQQAIEPGMLTIRNRDSNPLLAKRLNHGSAINVMSAVLQGLAEGGRSLGEPAFSRTIIGRHQTDATVERQVGESVLGGVMAGVFGDLADQLQQRVEDSQTSNPTSPALVVEAGETVRVVVGVPQENDTN